MRLKAVFLDRDGTINEDLGYVKYPSDVKLLEGAGTALKALRTAGYLNIVISNQSGVARGLITENDVELVNSRINELLGSENVHIDRFYFCTHHPEMGNRTDCNCRKPLTGLIEQAVADYDIDLSGAYFIGNMDTDIECANNAGIKAILVRSSQFEEAVKEVQKKGLSVDFFADNLREAVNFILKEVHE